MMTSISKNKTFLYSALKIIISLCFWVVLWQLASMYISDDLKLFLPSPVSVFKSFILLCGTGEFYSKVFASLMRIVIGFASGVVAGMLFGILTSELNIFDTLFSPAFRVIRAVPVVSFIILAYLFIDTDNLPIFISFLMVVPLVWQTTHDSLKSAVPELCEMGKVFGLNRFKLLYKIKLPAVFGELLSVTVSALGFAWKSGIAAEVICSPEISLGKSILKAKNNLGFDEVYALTLTVIILSIIFEIVLKRLCGIYLERKEKEYGKNR